MVLVGREGRPKTGKGRGIPPSGKETDRWEFRLLIDSISLEFVSYKEDPSQFLEVYKNY